MSWEQEPLWAKSKLFFERAFNEEREDPIFGLWCSLGLELLGRAAIASMSPTLLAEPDHEHKFLLHALNRGADRVTRKSISSNLVFTLCKTLFSHFTEDDFKIALALINRRNEELHSGGAAFEEYKSTKWLTGFYKVCNSLCIAMNKSLSDLFGEEEAAVAEEIIAENKKEVSQRIAGTISAHRKVFGNKPDKEQESLRSEAEENGNTLSLKRHHRVNCPACNCIATVQGEPFGKVNISHGDDSIIVRQAVMPALFECDSCGLRLSGYAELEAAGLGGQHTRKTSYTPEEFYSLDSSSESEEDEFEFYPEYDNEQ
jgi:hypothetical protein